MNSLEKKIIRRIKEEGPITFETFMDMALYDPELGYYTSERTKIGREGDFYTSSHLHPVFGFMIGRQIEEMWEIMGKPENFSIIEIGAGEGYVCRDMLYNLRGRTFFKILNYIIIEINPIMMAKQKKVINDCSEKVTWVSSLRQIRNIRGCFFSNELFDALPVHIVQMNDELNEIYINVNRGILTEEMSDLRNTAIAEYFDENKITFNKGYRTEVNLKMGELLDEIGNSLEEGFIITVDYGYSALEYYSEERNRGTLMCYYNHQLNENPYQHIGQQDITAHVNFSAVKNRGEKNNLKTVGYCSQGAFLLSLGIDEEIRKLFETSSDYLFELARIKKLIMPQAMGDSHKVMVQYKGSDSLKLRGFNIRNQIGSL